MKVQAIDGKPLSADGKLLKANATPEPEQSDKLGYDWKVYTVNDVAVRKEYVAQANPTGTKDNPIDYAEGVPLINNAYYRKDGKIYVWMGEWVEWE